MKLGSLQSAEWKNFASKARLLVKHKKHSLALREVNSGLIKFPHHDVLLCIKSDIARTFGKHEDSLVCARELIEFYPDSWPGYVRAAQDLISLSRLSEALAMAQKGLDKLPDQINLLNVAIDALQTLQDYEKSLEYSDKLIYAHAGYWRGYTSSFLAKVSLSRLNRDEDLSSLIAIQAPSHNTHWQNLWSTIACNPRDQESSKRNHWLDSFSIHRKTRLIPNRETFNHYQPFQYWSQGDPPRDVKTVMEKWNLLFNAIGVLPVRLFSKAEAAEYIEAYCPELFTSFMTAFHYAVESDVFRVAFAQKNDCIWLDSDLFPTGLTKGILVSLLESQKTTLLFRWFKPYITNAFFITRKADPFFQSILKQTKHIDFRVLPKNKATIFSTFGENRYNSILSRALSAKQGKLGAPRQISEFEFVNDYNFVSMSPPFELDYKQTCDSWQRSSYG